MVSAETVKWSKRRLRQCTKCRLADSVESKWTMWVFERWKVMQVGGNWLPLRSQWKRRMLNGGETLFSIKRTRIEHFGSLSNDYHSSKAQANCSLIFLFPVLSSASSLILTFTFWNNSTVLFPFFP